MSLITQLLPVVLRLASSSTRGMYIPEPKKFPGNRELQSSDFGSSINLIFEDLEFQSEITITELMWAGEIYRVSLTKTQAYLWKLYHWFR